jgi:hypothetical protein
MSGGMAKVNQKIVIKKTAIEKALQRTDISTIVRSSATTTSKLFTTD